MPDYKNGKIYKLVCSETNKIYIGSTIQPLYKRLYHHKAQSSKHSASKYLIEPKIFLIEDFPCERKEQLLMRERYFIENLECVNLNIPKRTIEERKEYVNNYYQVNKDKWIEGRKKNIEKIRERKKEKYTCDCGSTLRKNDKARHEKTKKHLNFLANK